MPAVSVNERMVLELRDDPEYRKQMFAEAQALIAEGEFEPAAIILRRLILATGGFVNVGEDIGKSSKAVMNMLHSQANPTVRNFFSIMRAVKRNIAA